MSPRCCPSGGPAQAALQKHGQTQYHSMQRLSLMTWQVLQGKQAMFQVLQSQRADALQLVPIKDTAQPQQ